MTFDRAPIEQPYSQRRLAAKKDVFCDRKLRNQVKFLSNRADACLLRLDRAGKSYLLISQANFPGRRI